MKTSVVKRLDFEFLNSIVKVVANRNHPEIKLAGVTIGPFEEGNEYETYYWIAKELEKSGIARVGEDESLSPTKISKIQWTERVQTAGQVSKVPENFYPKLRRYLSELKRDIVKAPEKMLEFEKAKNLARDVVNTRVRKIVAIASAPAQTEQAFKNFTLEERFLYDQLHQLISEWRTEILEYNEAEEE
ncbi:MAG: DNA replication complex GINS family protein [Candidatus Bathyarchaeota archaeon]|nr:DNA replication complex GINS family protein [Candidatus Bathyarchaeota archaeon]